MTLYDVIENIDTVNAVLLVAAPPWLYFRTRAAGLLLGTLYLWQMIAYSEAGLPVILPVHPWHDFVVRWIGWGWLASLVYLIAWYLFIRLLQRLWHPDKPPMDLTPPNSVTLRPLERIAVVFALIYLGALVAILFRPT
jgi:hypothetical protein